MIIKNEELLIYLEKEILPLYEGLDGAHNRKHIENVTEFAANLSDSFPEINPEMILTACVYHDLGNLGTGGDKDDKKIIRKNHHITSAKIVKSDPNLKRWFSDDEIDEIAIACYQHRNSYKGDVKNMLSKIVADSDRSDSIDLIRIMERTYVYTKSHHIGEWSDEEVFEEVYQHICSKCKKDSSNAMSFYLPESEELMKEALDFSRKTLEDKEMFMQMLKNLILGRKW